MITCRLTFKTWNRENRFEISGVRSWEVFSIKHPWAVYVYESTTEWEKSFWKWKNHKIKFDVSEIHETDFERNERTVRKRVYRNEKNGWRKSVRKFQIRDHFTCLSFRHVTQTRPWRRFPSADNERFAFRRRRYTVGRPNSIRADVMISVMRTYRYAYGMLSLLPPPRR